MAAAYAAKQLPKEKKRINIKPEMPNHLYLPTSRF